METRPVSFVFGVWTGAKRPSFERNVMRAWRGTSRSSLQARSPESTSDSISEFGLNHPPAIAAKTMYGSSPETMASGNGASAGSLERSCWQAKNLRKGRR